jgi:hypothetical protein
LAELLLEPLELPELELPEPELLEPEPLEPEPLEPLPEDEPPELPDPLDVLLVVLGLLELLATVAEDLLVEVWYPKSSTTMVTVAANHSTIRLISSPPEPLGVDLTGRYARG